MPAQAAAPVRISVQDASAAPGDYVNIQVFLDANQGINGLQFHLEYDQRVLESVRVPDPIFGDEVVSVVPGNIIGLSRMPSLSERFGISWRPPGSQAPERPNVPHLNHQLPLNFETANLANVTRTGVLVTVHFRVLETATPGSASTIRLGSATASQRSTDYNVKTDVGGAAGSITVVSPTLVSNWDELRAEIENAPNDRPLRVQITNNFGGWTWWWREPIGDAIEIPAGREITLVSADGGEKIVGPPNDWQRHFIVYGDLTLGANITLDGGREAWNDWHWMDWRDSGGIEVSGGGTLTMLEGSVIENSRNSMGGAVLVADWWGGANGRATFYMKGGEIRYNSATFGGGVHIVGNARMNMSGGSIAGNITTGDGGGMFVSTGTIAAGQGFRATSGSIHGNFAYRDGGGIDTGRRSSEQYLPDWAYADLYTGDAVEFSDNVALNGTGFTHLGSVVGLSDPPYNAEAFTNLRFASSSANDHILNNFDIGYTGRLTWWWRGSHGPFGFGATPLMEALMGMLMDARTEEFLDNTGLDEMPEFDGKIVVREVLSGLDVFSDFEEVDRFYEDGVLFVVLVAPWVE